jgi:acetate kinase
MNRHNASALEIIKSSLKRLDAPNIAFFDSTFHSTIPDYIKTYMIDQKIAVARGLRKYGFHGTSYSNILRQVSAHLGKDPDQLSIIALHLGSGASACAIRNGKSVDTS